MSDPNIEKSVFTRFDVMLGFMAIVSLIVVLAPRDWLNKSYELIPNKFPTALFDDKYSGGSSSVEWVSQENTHWSCQLSAQYRNPYCSLQITLADKTGAGLDLSEFNLMRIWLDYKGAGEHVRLYLRNRNSNYYKTGDDSTTKYNLVEVPVKSFVPGLKIDFENIGVADWWLASKNIPIEFSRSEFNDVIFLEIQTGSTSFDGLHEFKLDKITWEGVLITDEQLYRGMVLSWSVLIFIFLIIRMIRLKIELGKNRRYRDELVSINRLLNMQNKQFEDLAKTDQLTGLLNRIGIRDPLYNGLNDWKGSRKPFSLVMIDIDHFKKVNDTFGHDIGDKILKGAADLFKLNVRQSDCLARWGGEEFILVCPNTDINQAQMVAETLRKKLADATIHPDLKVTASFGVASLTQPSLDYLFKCSDEALYEAKRNGRNQVVTKY